ncbi:MAG: oligosaccharide flippase family protein [Thermoleophilia bacterium]|nr:oligosaccharide flippase family protein [Thermoleophilia bacterium]
MARGGEGTRVDRRRALRDEQAAALDRRIVRQSGWVAVSYGTRTALAAASMLALVRLLDPRAFGLVALATVFLAIMEHLQESGLGAAVIQRRDGIREAAGSAVAASAVSGVAAAGLVVAAAPLAARLLHAPGLTDVLRGLAPILAIRGLAVVPAALLERELDYRGNAQAQLAAGLAQPAVSIALAASGAGVWSLVGGQLGGTLVGTAVVWMVVPWRPDPRAASWRMVRSLVRYGRFVGGANIVNLLNDTLDNLTVGRLLGTRALGFYAVTWRLADMPSTVIGNSVGRVLFPVYSAFRSDRETVRRVYVQNLQRLALLSLPVSAVLAAGAEPIVRGLLGTAWLPVVWPLRILAVYGAVKALCAPSGEVFKGMGRPQLALVFGGVHTVLVVPVLILLTSRFGLNGAASALLVVVCASGIPALASSLRLVRASRAAVARSLAGPLACAGMVAATLVAVSPEAARLQPQAGLALVLVAGGAVYCASVALLARPIVAPIVASFRRPGGAAVPPDERAAAVLSARS